MDISIETSRPVADPGWSGRFVAQAAGGSWSNGPTEVHETSAGPVGVRRSMERCGSGAEIEHWLVMAEAGVIGRLAPGEKVGPFSGATLQRLQPSLVAPSGGRDR